MNIRENVLRFTCNGATLFGILSEPVAPASPAAGSTASGDAGTAPADASINARAAAIDAINASPSASRGMLIVVGGPQYRAGSHRQFALLARDVAAAGVPVMRFDYRGMGDSEGVQRAFDTVDDDLRAAVDCFFTAVPSLRSIAIWGLCDGACAALFYSHTDARVDGLVLLNPWIRTEAGLARAQLKHYYLRRLVDRKFWLKIASGHFAFGPSLRSLADAVAKVVAPKARLDRNGTATEGTVDGGVDGGGATAAASLPQRMQHSFARFKGQVLLIISGRDLTAKEFLDTVAGSRGWKKILAAPRVTRHDLLTADHTFSTRAWRDQVSAWTRAWLQSR